MRGNKAEGVKQAWKETKPLQQSSRFLSFLPDRDLSDTEDFGDNATSCISTTSTWGSSFDDPANVKVTKANTWPRDKGVMM